MMWSLFLIMTTGVSLVLGEETFIDLTHSLGKTTIYWPSNPPFNFTNLVNASVSDTVIYTNYIYTPEHIGTHMDAPRHFCPQGKFISDFSIDQLSGPGVVLDFEAQAAKDVDYRVTLQDVQNWESDNGQIPTGAVVLFKFGWNKYWPNWEQVFNTDDIGNSSSYHWPGLSLEASQHIAGTRKVKAIGLDVVSGDPGQGNRDIHKNILCDNGIIILENVANINAMPTTGSRVFIGAVKLEEGGGVPVRLFAVVDDKGNVNSARGITPNLLHVVLLIGIIMH